MRIARNRLRVFAYSYDIIGDHYLIPYETRLQNPNTNITELVFQTPIIKAPLPTSEELERPHQTQPPFSTRSSPPT